MVERHATGKSVTEPKGKQVSLRAYPTTETTRTYARDQNQRSLFDFEE